jgi:hypothetical protein
LQSSNNGWIESCIERATLPGHVTERQLTPAQSGFEPPVIDAAPVSRSPRLWINRNRSFPPVAPAV